MKIRKIVVALLLLGTSLAADAAMINLQTTDSATLADGAIKIIVKLEKLPMLSTCLNASSWRWGSEQSCPNRLIASLEVEFQKQPVFIPYSAFADLGNPSSISIERRAKGKTYFIKIKGGESATSYSAVLKFKAGLLIEKIVRHGEFPDNAWEKTSYKFNTSAR